MSSICSEKPWLHDTHLTAPFCGHEAPLPATPLAQVQWFAATNANRVDVRDEVCRCLAKRAQVRAKYNARMHQRTRIPAPTCAHGVDAATAVALGTEALVQIDTVHTCGLATTAHHSGTLVHVCTDRGGAPMIFTRVLLTACGHGRTFADFVLPAADPPLGAITLETV